MLKMRLQRFGRKNDPSFRVVVLEGTEGPKSGNHVDQIGSYNAITKQKTLNKERASYWLSKGVQPSDTVYNFLVSEGVLQGKKKNVLPSKKPIVKDASTEASAKVEEPKSEEASQASVASPEASVEETPAPEVIAEEATSAPSDETPVVEETPTEPVSEAQEATEADSTSTEPAA